MNKIFAAIGVTDFKSYLEKYFLPIFLMDFFVLFLFLFGFQNGLARTLGFFVFFAILFVLFAYPLMIIDNQSRNIEENLHYFITYAGALSTVNLERKDMFSDLSEKIRYREIARAFKKLLYLVESIKIDFSTSAYKTSALYKSEHFSRFLERMGIALSFNSDLSNFFLTEQKVLMDSYSVIYKEGLERIKIVQEMFSSLTLAFAFVLATILLMPFLTGIEGSLFLKFGIMIILLIDIIIITFAKFYLPEDSLYHQLGLDEGRKKAIFTFFISLFLSIVIMPFVLFMDVSLMMRIAILFTPFMIVGAYASYQEKLVWKTCLLPYF
jgi:archaellum biogenesis protein FlaJ (TadC family)